MLTGFAPLQERLQKGPGVRLAVAGADSREVLAAVGTAVQGGFAEPLLLGCPERVKELAREAGLPLESPRSFPFNCLRGVASISPEHTAAQRKKRKEVVKCGAAA